VIPALLAFGSVYLGLNASHSIVPWIERHSSYGRPKIGKSPELSEGPPFLMIVFLTLSTMFILKQLGVGMTVIPIVGLLILFSSLYFVTHSEPGLVFRSTALLFVWTFCGVALLFYIFIVYPYFPVAVGGLQPRCAYLDLSKDQLSAPTLDSLLPGDQAKAPDKVGRSTKLDILFYGTDRVIVRLPRAGPDQTFELKADVVRAASWVGSGPCTAG
jgi:hypothetical protein